MKRVVRLVALAGLVLGLAPASARALTYDVCGGSYSGYSGFALCASVTVDLVTTQVNGVDVHSVTMVVHNLSGQEGSYSGSLFTAFGLRNVVPSDVKVIGGSLQVLGPCIGATDGSICDYSSQWQLNDDEGIGAGGGAGGVSIDLRTRTTNGVNYSVASSCVPNNPLLGQSLLLYTACTAGGAGGVVLSFQVSSAFTFDEGSLYIRAQNGYPDGEGSTVCITEDGYDCGPTTVVPEPLTITLLATGLAGLGGAHMRRRRKRDEVEA